MFPSPVMVMMKVAYHKFLCKVYESLNLEILVLTVHSFTDEFALK